MIENESVFVPSGRVAFRRVGEQVVLVNPDDNVLMTLNSTGSEVWEWLDGKRSVEEIAVALQQKFEVSTEEALRDVVTFLGLMLDRKLVERATVGSDE